MEMFPSLKQQELDLLGLMSALKRKKGGGSVRQRKTCTSSFDMLDKDLRLK